MRSMVPWKLAPALLCLALVSGCSSFYHREVVGGATETVFDDRLPAGIKEVFDTCHSGGVLFVYNTTAVDFRGTCQVATDLPSVPGQLVFAAVAAKSPLPMDFPGKLYDMRGDFADFPWPMQNCYVVWDSEVYFWAMGFSSLTGSWVQRSGAPALKLMFGNPRKQASPFYKPAYWNTIATAHCPSPVNQGVIRAKLDSCGLNGIGDVRAQDFDLDLYFVFGKANNALTVSVEAVPVFQNLTVDVDWDKLPKQARTQFDKQIATLSNKIADSISKQLKPLTELIEDPMQGAVPRGHQICQLSIRNGEFVITTDDKCS